MGFPRADAFVNEMSNPTMFNINDYQGRVSLFRGTWEQENVRDGTGEITQTGTSPLWLTLLGSQNPLDLNVTSAVSVDAARNAGMGDILPWVGWKQAGEAHRRF